MLTIGIIALLALALLGAPLFIVLAAIALLIAGDAELDPAVLVVELYRMAASPNLLAIPLFTLAGVALARGGAPERLVALFNGLLGWMPGGLAIVALTACAFFTAFSGASGITILALGGLLYPMLRQQGYDKPFTLGLLTTSGSLGLLFPPSLAILLYGVIAGVSIEDLFVAGLLPGILLMVLLSAYSMFRAHADQAPRHAFSWPAAALAIRRGFWDLLLPPAILGSIYSGLVSVTEAAACTAAYVLAVDGLIHRSLHVRRDLISITVEATRLVGTILIIVLVAMALNSLLVDQQIPDRLLALIERHVDGRIGFLLLLNLFLLAVGSVMDIFSAIVVVVPLILPLAARFGIDPVHLGIIFLANLEIGYSTPPVGMNLFIACQRFEQPIATLIRATLPFLLIMLAWLLAVTYIEPLSLWWR